MSSHNTSSSLENFKFHLLLIGTSPTQILQRLDKYVYIHQEIDCLYNLLKHRFYYSYEEFNQLIRAVQHNLRWKGAKKFQVLQRNDSFGKNQETLSKF